MRLPLPLLQQKVFTASQVDRVRFVP
eukprot:COSAG02_NODE_30647_length_547_cov_1.198661_1_plen_25_part_10